MHCISKNNYGFTFMEILVTIIILGVMVSMALPQYAKTVDRARLQDGVNQLTAIHSAMLIYRAQNGGTILDDGGSAQDHTYLNTNLGLSVTPNGLTYSFSSDPGAGTFTVTATGVGKTLTLSEAPASYPTNPTCTPAGGSCP